MRRELDRHRRAGDRYAARAGHAARQLRGLRVVERRVGGVERHRRSGRGAGRQLGRELGGLAADLRQLAVQRVAGTGGAIAVAVTGDALQRHRRAGAVAVRRAAARQHRHAALHWRAVQRQLPRQQLRRRLHGVSSTRRAAERADVRDARRDAVVALRLGADDGLLDAARAPLEDLAEAVDEEVVADVAPAVGVAVIAADREHDRRAVLGPVVVGVDRVVHEARLHGAVARRAARRALIGAPLPRAARSAARRLRPARSPARPRARRTRVCAARRSAVSPRSSAVALPVALTKCARRLRGWRSCAAGRRRRRPPTRARRRAARVVAGHLRPRTPVAAGSVAHADARRRALARRSRSGRRGQSAWARG